jgi:hypothetical protein
VRSVQSRRSKEFTAFGSVLLECQIHARPVFRHKPLVKKDVAVPNVHGRTRSSINVSEIRPTSSFALNNLPKLLPNMPIRARDKPLQRNLKSRTWMQRRVRTFSCCAVVILVVNVAGALPKYKHGCDAATAMRCDMRARARIPFTKFGALGTGYDVGGFGSVQHVSDDLINFSSLISTLELRQK